MLAVRVRGFLAEDAGRFFRNARSSFSSAVSLRSRSNSALSDSVTSVCPVSLRVIDAVTQPPRLASLTPSSRATVATALPVVMTSFTASSLYSGVNSRRDLAIVNILSCEVSTTRGRGHTIVKGR